METMVDLTSRLQREGRAAREAELARHAAVVESVRAELKQDYEQSKAIEPDLKQEAGAILREAAELEQAVAESGGHGPNIAQQIETIKAPWNGGVVNNFPQVSVFDRMKAGRQAYEHLTFGDLVGPDGHHVDENRRAAFLVQTRRLLRAWDGERSASRQALGSLKRYISDWLAAR